MTSALLAGLRHRRPASVRFLTIAASLALLSACRDNAAEPADLDAAPSAVVLPPTGIALDPQLGTITDPPTATCGVPYSTRLLAINKASVGTVRISNDAAALYVTFDATQPIRYSGVAVARDKHELPFLPSGAPIAARFPVSPLHEPNRREITWRIPVQLNAGDVVHVAAFARVGPFGAWAEGARFSDIGAPFTTIVMYVAGACSTASAVGENGGVVAAPGDVARVDIPAGALASTVEISIEPITTTVDNTVPGTAFDFGPDGTTFSEPVVMRIAFDPSRLPPGIAREQLRLAQLVNGSLEIVPGSGAVQGSNVVEGEVTHFSAWVIAWLPQVDLRVVPSIVFNPTTASALRELTATATISNLSLTDRAEDAILEFRFEGSVSVFVYEQPAGCTPTSNGTVSVIRCTVNLGTGESATRTVRVQPIFAGSAINVTIQARTPITLTDPNFLNDVFTSSINIVVANSADVAVSLVPAASLSSKGGDLIEITGDLRYIESSVAVLDNAVYVVDVTGAVSVEPLDPRCSFALKQGNTGAVIGCSSRIAQDLSARFSVGIRSTSAPQSLTVQVSAQAPIGFTDPNPNNNTVTQRVYTVSARSTDLAILQFVADQTVATVGEQVLYTFTGENLGPDAIPSSTLRFRVPTGGALTFLPENCTDVSSVVADAVRVDCVFGTVASGANTPTRSIGVTPTTIGQALSASVDYLVPAITTDPNPANNVRSINTSVPLPQADLRTVIVPTPQIARGFVPVTFGVLISNTNIANAESITPTPETLVDLTLSSAVSQVTVPNGCTLGLVLGSNRSYTCSVPPIVLGQPFTLNVVATPSQVNQSLRLTATTRVPNGVTDPLLGNNTTTLDVPVVPRSADVFISSFTDSPDPVAPGTTFGYGIRVRSASNSTDVIPLTRLEVRVSGDVELAIRPAACSDASAAFAERVVLLCDIGPLAPNTEILTPVFLRAIAPNQTITATARVVPFGDAVDPNLTNNEATQTTTVTPLLSADRVYVGNLEGQSITVLDAATNSTSSTIALNSAPNRIVKRPGSTEIWSANSSPVARTVQVVTTTTDAVVANLILPSGTNPRDVAFTPNGARAYVVDVGGNRVLEYDASTRGLLATITFPISPYRMVVTPDGSRGYVLAVSDSLFVVDLSSRQILERIGGLGVTGGLTVSDDGSSVIVLANTTSPPSSAIRISTMNNREMQRVEFVGNLTSVITTFSGNEAWLLNTQSSRLFQVDFEAGTATSLTQFNIVPTDLAWSRNRDAFWVVFRSSGQVGRYSTGSLVQQWLTPVGLQPFTIAVP